MSSHAVLTRPTELDAEYKKAEHLAVRNVGLVETDAQLDIRADLSEKPRRPLTSTLDT